MYDSRPTFAEIDLSALRHNFRLIQATIADDTEILAVVKADAYGHGFMDVSRELEALGVNAFGVAFLAEGIQLRKSGIDKPVLLLGGVYPGQERKCIGYNLSTTVFSLEQLISLNQAAKKLFRKALVHLKIDTGMGRLGIDYTEVPRFLSELKKLPHIHLEGVVSHFATADELDESGTAFTALQAERFTAALAGIREAGFAPRYVHIANSAATFALPALQTNLVRPGIVLYGSLPSPDFADKVQLMPVMRLKSRVAMLKSAAPDTSISYARRYTTTAKTLVASVPVGYADGYPRSLTNRGQALVRGVRVPTIGTICMDWLMLDVSAVPDVQVGDEVTLLGEDRQGNCIHAEEVAAWAGTIPYEIFCGISKRVPRVYLP